MSGFCPAATFRVEAALLPAALRLVHAFALRALLYSLRVSSPPQHPENNLRPVGRFGLEVPGDAVQLFGDLTRFNLAAHWFGYLGADAVNWRVSDFDELVFAGYVIPNLREFVHAVSPQWS